VATVAATKIISSVSTPADQTADRQVLGEALAQLGEVDVQHHDDEQEQHRDRAHIDDDQQHRQELRAQQDEEAGGREEGGDQEEHRVHRVSRRDDEKTRRQVAESQQIESDRLQGHWPRCSPENYIQ
jgi:hypothetical protein